MLEGSVATTSGVYCDSFHGFCSSVLRKHISLLKVDHELEIADENVQLKVMTSILESKGYKTSTSSTMNLLRQIRFWKERGLGYLGIRSEALRSLTEKRAYALYPEYQSKLRAISALDFGDLLLFTLRLFREQPEVLDIYRSRFHHILVDEFQDISPAQYDILRILAVGGIGKYDSSQHLGGDPGEGDTGKFIPSKRSSISNLDPTWLATPPTPLADEYRINGKAVLSSEQRSNSKQKPEVHVFCAGDDDQSIYAWRGSQIELMRRFRFDFPNSKVLKFDVSYRMPTTLCKATSIIVDPLAGRIPKQLSTETETLYNGGTSLEVRRLSTEAHELEWIVAYLSRSQPQGEKTSIAVVARSQFDIRRISETLDAKGVPFNIKTTDVGIQASTVFNGPLSFLKLAMNPENNAAFKFSLEDSIFFRGIPQEKIEDFIFTPLREIAESKGQSYLEASRHCVLTKKIFPEYSKSLERFIRSYDSSVIELQQSPQPNKSLQDIIKQVLLAVYGRDPIPAVTKAIEELARNACVYTNFVHFMSVFLQDSNNAAQPWLFSEDQPSENSNLVNKYQDKSISVMNMHAAKGLEFDEVILPFWIDGNVPRSDTPDERRLAFVSLTRAKRKVMISFSRFTSRGLKANTEAKPSVYIDELVNKRDGLQDILFEDLSDDTRSCDQIILEAEDSKPKRRKTKSSKSSKQDIISPTDGINEEVLQVSPATSKELFGDAFEIKKTLRKSSNIDKKTVEILATKVNPSFLPSSPLRKIDVKELLGTKSIKASVVKKLFSDEIRRLFSCKRATIKVLENGSEVTKALSSCNVQQLGQYLLKFLEN